MNTLWDNLGQVVSIDENRDMTLRFLKHGCPDGEYSIDGPGIDMTFYRIDGIVYPSGGTIDGQKMPPRTREECVRTFGGNGQPGEDVIAIDLSDATICGDCGGDLIEGVERCPECGTKCCNWHDTPLEGGGSCPDRDATTITLVIWRGVLDDVIGLPEGWACVLRDHDVDHDSWPEADERCVRIEVEGGIITGVENLPDGYDYEVEDHDEEDEGE